MKQNDDFMSRLLVGCVDVLGKEIHREYGRDQARVGMNDSTFEERWEAFRLDKKIQMETFVDSNHGFTEHLKEFFQIQGGFNDYKMSKLEPFISKIGGWANFIEFLEREIK